MAASSYATVGQLRRRVGADDIGEDDLLGPALVAASRTIDQWCGRRFYQDDLPVTARAVPVDRVSGSFVDLGGWDISTDTGLLVATDTNDDGVYETSLTLGTHFQVEPLANYSPSGEAWPITGLRIISAGGEYFPFNRGRPTVQITARWGWPAVPGPVQQACLCLAADIWKSKDVVYGAGGSGFLGTFDVRQNLMAVTLLAPYRYGASLVGVA
jgi:hypothetical protein